MGKGHVEERGRRGIRYKEETRGRKGHGEGDEKG